MSNDIKMNNNSAPAKNTQRYAESKGTGVISTLIFAVAVIIFMVAVAYFKGS